MISSIAAALTLPAISHALHIRDINEHRVKTGCVDLSFANPEVTIDGPILDMDFYNATWGVGMQVMSYDYKAADSSKTGTSGDLIKINMQSDTTSTYHVEIWGLGGPHSPEPCYYISFFDIDCKKNGCQQLEVNLGQFGGVDYFVTSDTMLQATEAGGVLKVMAKEGKGDAPKTLPMTSEQAKYAITFAITDTAKWSFKYTIPELDSGGSFYWAGSGGMDGTPEPVEPVPICEEVEPTPEPTPEPTDECPYGSTKTTMSDFFPTSVYEDSERCPAGRVIKVCWNKADYSLGSGYGWPGQTKLENSANFGPSGTVAYSVVTVELSKPITKEKLWDNCDIFQIGVVENDAWDRGVHTTLSATEMAEMREWAEASPNNVVWGVQNYIMDFGNYGKTAGGAQNPMTVTELGSHSVSLGPFGDGGSFDMGGSWRGTLGSLAETACVLVHDKAHKPVIVYDTKVQSVFLSDVDVITQLSGGLTTNEHISSTNDKLFGNMYAFMIGMVCNGGPTTCAFDEDPFPICKPAPVTTNPIIR